MARYRVRNWTTYNAGLINRGNITMWIDDDVLANVPDTEPTRGRPRLYSDALVQALLGLKTVFHLPLRALQGFAQSLRDLAFADLPVPNYTTVCRRAQTLRVKLPVIHSGEPLHLVVDSTGVKVYGEGEWKVRQHGYNPLRTAASTLSPKWGEVGYDVLNFSVSLAALGAPQVLRVANTSPRRSENR